MRPCAALLLALVACGGSERAADRPAIVPAGPRVARPMEFSFESLDARPVSSRSMRGRTSVVAFVTTWDLASQAQARYLVKMAEHDADRTNYALVAVQEASSRELVEAWARAIGVTFPIAITGGAALPEAGVFGDVREVPTTFVFDEAGRVVHRQSGVVSAAELRAHLPKSP